MPRRHQAKGLEAQEDLPGDAEGHLKRILGVCGTPGTGKKTIAPLLARPLSVSAISINSLASKAGAKKEDGEMLVDPVRVRRELAREAPPGAVVYGHLLPHVLRKGEAAFVAVLRCEPSVLRERLVERGYAPVKVTENVEAELIGVVLDECVRRFGAPLVHEYDTTSSTPRDVAKAIARDSRAATRRGKKAASTKPPAWIDWTMAYDSSSKLRSLLAGRREPPAST